MDDDIIVRAVCWCYLFTISRNEHARNGPPINGMDQVVLDQEGDMNTFNNRIQPYNSVFPLYTFSSGGSPLVKKLVFPIHRPLCGAAPQNQHRAPQIDSRFFFGLGPQVCSVSHTLIYLWRPATIAENRTYSENFDDG